MKSLLSSLGAIFLIAVCVNFSWAESYPNRPIRWVIPFPAGGTLDTNARTLTQQLERQMGQSFVVDNRSGANGIIGTEIVAKAQKDGYTVLQVSSSIASNLSTYRKLPYDTLKDLAPVTRIASAVGFILIASPSFSGKSISDLVQLGKQEGKVAFGSPGIGSSMHFGVEAFNLRTGTKLVHVPYKGIALAMNAVMGGEVQVALLPPTIAVPQIKSGKVRALAFAGEKRWNLMPDLPTISETIPGLVIPAGWDGLFIPSGTPKEIIARLQKEISEAIKVAKVRDQLVNGGYIPLGESTAEFDKFLRSEIKRYAEMAKKIGIKPL